MLLTIKTSQKLRYICSRRGQNEYRHVIPNPGDFQIEYDPLPDSVVELVTVDGVIGELVLGPSIPDRGMFIDVNPPRQNVGSSFQWTTPENDESLQPMGGEHDHHGDTIPRSADIQVPPVDTGDARLPSGQDSGAKISTDGLHGSDAAPSDSHDRSAPGVGIVLTPLENPGCDGLQHNEVRSDAGDQSKTGSPV